MIELRRTSATRKGETEWRKFKKGSYRVENYELSHSGERPACQRKERREVRIQKRERALLKDDIFSGCCVRDLK